MKLHGKFHKIQYFLIFLFPLMESVQSQEKKPDSSEDKSFYKYTHELTVRYNYKDYLGAIFENEKTRQDFARFVNDHLTEQIKNDLKAVRVFKKIDNEEMPMVPFNSNMDSWLGILPQWKRVKKFLFGEMRNYIDLHPEIFDSLHVNRPQRHRLHV